jgi:uncharacterized protein YbjQ (UPF0145 family)
MGVFGALTADLGAGAYYCPACTDRRAAAKEKAARHHFTKIQQAAAKVIVTTTPTVEGYRVCGYLGIESVEFVIGTGLFSEITTEVQDLFGARSSAFEKKLQQAKQATFDRLRFVAAEKGAHAVIGVDMDFTEFSNNRVALILNGTLVKLEPITVAD